MTTRLVMAWQTQFCKHCKSLNVIRVTPGHGLRIGGCRCNAIKTTAAGAWKRVPDDTLLIIWDEVPL